MRPECARQNATAGAWGIIAFAVLTLFPYTGEAQSNSSPVRLEFMPREIGIVTGESETVSLSLTGAPLLPAGEQVVVELSLPEASTVSLLTSMQLTFSASTTHHDVTLMVPEGAELGATTLRAVAVQVPANLGDAGLVDGELDVNVIETREFEWVFRSAETGVALSTVMVVAGRTTRLVVSLEGVHGERLRADEIVPARINRDLLLDARIRVLLSDRMDLTGPLSLEVGGDIPPPEVILLADITAEESELRLNQRGELPITLQGGAVPRRAMLPVRVVSVSVDLQLAFDPSMLTVVAGSSETVVLRLLGLVPRGARVESSVAVDMMAVVRVVTEPKLRFSAATQSHDVTVLGESAGSATVTADGDVLPHLGGSFVAPAELVVTVIEPPMVALQLVFDPPALTVTVGSEKTAVLSLLGVPEVAAVTVELSAADEATARVVTSQSVMFTAATTSHDVTVMGVAEGSVTVTAVLQVFDRLSADSTIASTELVMTVVEPPTVHLQLAFDPPVLTVTAGSEETAVLSLLGVPADAGVEVELRVMDAATARVVTSQSLMFTAATTSHAVAIAGVAEGSATVMAEAMDFVGLSDDSTVASVKLAVTVVLPTAMLQLAFDPTSLTVVVGKEKTATLSLVGVPEVAAVTVELSAMDATTARVVTSQSLMFTAATTSHEVTVLGVAAGNATVISVEITSGGLSDDSTIAPAELAVTVVLPTVELELSFDPPALTIAPGREKTVTLSLLGVPMGADVEVELRMPDESTARLVTSRMVTFTADTQNTRVTVAGVAEEGNVTVTAEVLSFRGLSEESIVRPAQLPVTVAGDVRLRVRVLLEGPLQ